MMNGRQILENALALTLRDKSLFEQRVTELQAEATHRLEQDRVLRRFLDLVLETALMRWHELECPVEDVPPIHKWLGLTPAEYDAWVERPYATRAPARIEEPTKTRAERVREFHVKFGHPVETTPHVPNHDQLRFRLSLITEEYFELLAACGINDPYENSGYGAGVIYAKETIRQAIEGEKLVVDLPELADAMEDLEYVIVGTRLVCGIDEEPIAAEVHRANMDKDAVYVAAKDGFHKGSQVKPTKPEGWRPPDIAAEFAKQGWLVPQKVST